MTHRFKVGQSVVPAYGQLDRSADRSTIYDVVRLLPELPSGELQYQIKARTSGIQRVVREAEIKATFA